MTVFIILNQAEADTVRGPNYNNTAALDPIQLLDPAVYILPLAVLADPAHAPNHAFLLTLPQREVLPEEFKPPPADDE